MQATGAIALVSLLALGVYVSSASAAPLSMTFTEARANVGIQLSVTNDEDALFKAPDIAPFEAQIDPGSGSIENGVLEVPDFTTFIEEDPVNADVTVEFDIGVITGSFTQTTGALALSGDAGGTLTAVTESGEKKCIVSIPETLTLTTAGNTGGPSPLFGAPFTAGLTGTGAIAGQWDDMEAEPVDPEPGGDTAACAEVDEHIGGPGGIWLEQKDFLAPLAPQLTSTDPASPSSSGTPRILGAAEAGSTVRVYASPACAGTPIATGNAAQLGSPGIAVEVAKGVTAAFSVTATDAAGNTSACSAPISYTRLKEGDPPPPPACTVPKLVGKTLARAKAALKAADCKVGKVQRPKQRKGKRRVLVVKSSNPTAGAKPADGKVDLRLGPKPRKARR
ncbi:MAG TPA: Ig-like domain-containing protein [Solirubrobacterales bacterium]|nr:Ig-like domain-containing protein [Solirubrobacterales bacterium]